MGSISTIDGYAYDPGYDYCVTNEDIDSCPDGENSMSIADFMCEDGVCLDGLEFIDFGDGIGYCA